MDFVRNNKKEIFFIVFVCFVAIPICFNFLIMWDSGFAKGKSSDWFVFFGNIVGGLISGFFTYLALLLTFKKNSEDENLIKADRLNTRIKECILDNKTFLTSLDSIFLTIQGNIVFEALNNAMEKYIDKENYDFNNENEFKSFSIDQENYRNYLKEILYLTSDYEKRLKVHLLDLSGNDFYLKQHEILVFNNMLKETVKSQINEKNPDYEVLSNFAIWKDNFGFRHILNVLKDSNDIDYQKLISEDVITDNFRTTIIPQIKG